MFYKRFEPFIQHYGAQIYPKKILNELSIADALPFELVALVLKEKLQSEFIQIIEQYNINTETAKNITGFFFTKIDRNWNQLMGVRAETKKENECGVSSELPFRSV